VLEIKGEFLENEFVLQKYRQNWIHS
jgi:hypothetical protein